MLRRVPFWAGLIPFAIVNSGLCRLGLALTPGPSRIALFWPAAGLVFGALLLSDRRRWAALRASALRSARLTRQLLAFARKEPPRAVSVDLHGVVNDVVTLLSRSIDKRIALRTDLSATPALARGDPDRLHTALVNLALNARDAMPEGGTLSFETRRLDLDAARCAALPLDVAPGPYLEVCVRDTGVGLSADARAHLFEPFFTTKAVGKGSGLGLAEVYGTVKAHRGAVTVESTSAKGTAVSPLFPASDVSGDATQPGVARAPAASLPRLRLLVADDEANVRRSLGLLLRTGGHDVIECDGGCQAVARCKAEPSEFDAAIVDMMMRDMTGREVISELRAITWSCRSSSLPGSAPAPTWMRCAASLA